MPGGRMASKIPSGSTRVGGNHFAAEQNSHLERIRMDRANDHAAGAVALDLMGSENAKRVRMLGPQKQRIFAQRGGVRSSRPSR